MLKAYVKIRKKKKKDEKRKALIFAVLFATLTFVSVGAASGTDSEASVGQPHL